MSGPGTGGFDMGTLDLDRFEHLGIAPTDDEREIKRAYARRLRQVRPDDDPAGFQALHEAYQYCLGCALYLRWQALEQAAGPPAQAAGHEDAHSHDDAAQAAHADAAHAEARHADRRPGHDLHDHHPHDREPQVRAPRDHAPHEHAPHERRPQDRGLHAHGAADDARAGPSGDQRATPAATAAPPATGPILAEEAAAPAWADFDFDAFMSELLHRAAVQPADELSRWLRESEPLYSLELKLALRAPVSQVLAGIERPLPVEATQAILEFFSLDVVDRHDAWLHERVLEARERAESSQRFGRTLEALQSHRVKPVDRLLTRELVGPRHRGRRLFIALVPLLPTRLRHALKALHDIDPQQAQAQLDPDATAFWRSATDPARLSARRLAIAAMRVVAYYAVLAGLLYTLVAEQALSPPRDLGIAGALWLGWAGAQAAFLRWVPETLVERLDRRSVLCALALIGAACLAPRDPFLASALAFVVTVMVSSEPSPTHGSLAHYASYTICAALGVGLFLGTGSWALAIPYALIGTGAIHIGHSIAVAWRHGIGVAEARRRGGAYWYLVALSGLVIAYGLYAMAGGGTTGR